MSAACLAHRHLIGLTGFMSPRSADKMHDHTNDTPAANGTRMWTGTMEKLIACIGTHSFQHCGNSRNRLQRAVLSGNLLRRDLKLCARDYLMPHRATPPRMAVLVV